MDIKFETQDCLPPSFYPDDRHFDKYNGNIPDQFKDEGRSTDRTEILHFKEEHIDVSSIRDCKKNVLNVKRKDDDEWYSSKDDISRDVFNIKIEQFDIDERSYCKTTTDQFLGVKPETSNMSLPSCLNLSLTQPFLMNNKTLFRHKSSLKKEEIDERIPVVFIKKTVFYERNFVCDVCYSLFSTCSLLIAHKRNHIEMLINVNYKNIGENIDICFKKTGEKSTFNTNSKKLDCEGKIDKCVKIKLLKNGQIPLKCKQCDYSSPLAYSLKTHIMTHTGEKPFKCDQCDYKSTKSFDLKRHKSKHANEKPYKCNECEYRTAYSFHLKTHKMSHSGEKPLKCDICNFRSAHSSHLKTHKLLHSGQKPFKCDQCNFKCVRSTDLKRHKMLHSGEKPYRCDICPYKTAHYTYLKTHKIAHASAKAFNCGQCEFSGLRSIDLKRHAVVHTGKESFKCDRCDFITTQSTYLKRHQISHSGVKSFECDRCDFKTAYSCNLKTHNNSKQMNCDHCNYKSANSIFLKKHVDSHLEMILSCTVLQKCRASDQ